jgi:leucyl-tRNA synthetase
MAVPGHDERDWEFARQFSLPIVEVIAGGDVSAAAHAGDGSLVNSGFLDGLGVDEAKQRMIAWLEERGLGERRVNYKLRDWLFSRQRYWGEPFPLIHTSDGQVRPLPLDALPLTLPHVDAYRPTEDGEPPLARAKEWLHTVDPVSGLAAVRETNTMPQWAGSCWYYLRYIDPHNDAAFVDPEKERYWMPVDLYVGGAEHAVLHLLYARFWHKVLYDCGLVSTREPFRRLFNQGMILAFSYKDEAGRYLYPEQVEVRDGKAFARSDGSALHMQVEKMSKSRYNVVNPDDVVAEFGADTLRLYEMYMGPLEATKPWQTDGARGMYRFLGRAYRLVTDEAGGLSPKVVDAAPAEAERKLLHATIKKVGEDIEGLRFNTAVAALIELVNALSRQETIARTTAETFALLLAPFAPHLGEEIWSLLGRGPTLAHEPWPAYDAAALVEETVTIPVQVNGKVRATIDVAKAAGAAEVAALARAHERVEPFLAGKEVVKEVYVPQKVLNFIVR